jgi:chemotaxis signal transduction protein
MSINQVHRRQVATVEVAVRHFCSFKIDHRLFGVDILQVREINTEVSFTPIFHSPPQVRGYVNIRGQIHLVVDPRVPLGLPEHLPVKGKQLLIFKQSVVESFALLVDKVGDIVQVGEDRIENIDGMGERSLITGVIKLDGTLLEVLQPLAFMEFKTAP